MSDNPDYVDQYPIPSRLEEWAKDHPARVALVLLSGVIVLAIFVEWMQLKGG